jgi:hypothetical protein
MTGFCGDEGVAHPEIMQGASATRQHTHPA